METLTIENVKDKIRAVPDFPKKGIIFRDIANIRYFCRSCKLNNWKVC